MCRCPCGGLDVEDGLDALPLIAAASPGTRVIVLTTFGRPGYLRRAMEAGAVGFLVKDTPVDRLVDGIRRAAAPGCGWSTPTWRRRRCPSGRPR